MFSFFSACCFLTYTFFRPLSQITKHTRHCPVCIFLCRYLVTIKKEAHMISLDNQISVRLVSFTNLILEHFSKCFKLIVPACRLDDRFLRYFCHKSDYILGGGGGGQDPFGAGGPFQGMNVDDIFKQFFGDQRGGGFSSGFGFDGARASQVNSTHSLALDITNV